MKKGFSFVELLLILAFFLVLLMALTPMITRRHLMPPGKANHGTYACYRNEANGSLHETLIKGRVTIKDLDVATCRFEPVKNAKYYYVQLIGGGGGGRSINKPSGAGAGQKTFSDESGILYNLAKYYTIYKAQEDDQNYKIGSFVTGCFGRVKNWGRYGVNATLNDAFCKADYSYCEYKGGCTGHSELYGLASNDVTFGRLHVPIQWSGLDEDDYRALIGYDSTNNKDTKYLRLYGIGLRGKKCDDDLQDIYKKDRNGIACGSGWKASENSPRTYCKAQYQSKYDGNFSNNATCKSYWNGLDDYKISLGSSNQFRVKCPGTEIEDKSTNPPTWSCNGAQDATNNCLYTLKADGTKQIESNTGKKFECSTAQQTDGCEVADILDNSAQQKNPGVENRFYVDVPLSYLYKSQISSTANLPDNNRLDNGAYKAFDGVSQYFDWTDKDGNTRYFHLIGGTGLVNPATYQAIFNSLNNDFPLKNFLDTNNLKNTVMCARHDSTYNQYYYDILQPQGEIEDAKYDCNIDTEVCNNVTQYTDNYPKPAEGEVGIYDYKALLLLTNLKRTQKQTIPFGLGGKAGELKSIIYKDIPENLPLNPGRGGAVDEDGEPTIFGGGDSGIPERRAEGGQAGNYRSTLAIKVDPYLYNADGTIRGIQGVATETGEDPNEVVANGKVWRIATTDDQPTRLGQKITFSAFVKFMISHNANDLLENMSTFGQGGDGESSKADCTFAYDYQPKAALLKDKEYAYEFKNVYFINKISSGSTAAPFSETFPRSRDFFKSVLRYGPNENDENFKCKGEYTFHEGAGYSGFPASNLKKEAETEYLVTGYEGYWENKTNSTKALTQSQPATAGKSGAIVISW